MGTLLRNITYNRKIYLKEDTGALPFDEEIVLTVMSINGTMPEAVYKVSRIIDSSGATAERNYERLSIDELVELLDKDEYKLVVQQVKAEVEKAELRRKIEELEKNNKKEKEDDDAR